MITDKSSLSWLNLKLGDVIDYGKTFKAEPCDLTDDTWVLELEDIEKDSSKLLQRLTFSERKSKSTKNRFEAGDVLYGKLRPYLNKVVLADSNGVSTTEIVPVKASKNLDNRFLFYWLKHPEFLAYVTEVGYGVNMPRLGTKDGLAAPFILAPLAEQREIADRLDTLLAQVDTLKGRLDALPATLKRFRQSVLAAAVSGKLTEEWRGLAEYSEDGYPSNWEKKGFSDIGELARGKSKHRPRNDPRLFGGDYPFVQTGEIANSNGRISSANKFYSEFGLSQSRLFPAGTLCITIAANIADTSILNIDACFPDSIVGFTPDSEICDAQFIKYLVDTNKENLERFAPATAQKNINLKVLNKLRLPIPLHEEQTEIVRRVEQLFAFANQVEQRVKEAQGRVNNLTQSILAKAFRGKLTAEWREQHPELISGENSASALLARIQAERAAQAPIKRTRKKKASA
ncbi:restriction endonuclease subunit S [Cobetia marina]|uniref:restriction endonuclease subunit S n=1 Tax=Cobetia marina TaxID=28258 RepID=UPI003A943DF5